jgi:hypothetical protein
MRRRKGGDIPERREASLQMLKEDGAAKVVTEKCSFMR